MIRRRFAPHAIVALSGAAIFLGASAVAAGCTTTTEEIQAADGGGDGAADGKAKFDSAPQPVEDADPPKKSEAECIADCEKTHATGLTKDKAIDTCWAAKCKGPCVDDTGVFDAGADAAKDAGGDAGGDGGAGKCTNDVETGDPACNGCTSVNCCPEWDGCFNDKDCSDLNDCRNTCVE
jgi:hypothetical protein